MKFIAWGHTDVGTVRTNNEDALHVDPDRGIFIVADGIGGHKAGEVASAALVEEALTTLGALGQAPPDPTGEAQYKATAGQVVRSAILRANEKIYTRAQAEPGKSSMGTTAIVAKLSGHTATIGHVGDSRAYLVRGGRVYQLTEDHTLLNQLRALGTVSAEDLANFPHKNVLSRAVGRAPTLEVDLISMDALPGDRFVACTDGVHEFVTPEEMRDMTMGNKPKAAAELLVAQALRRGSKDNCTAVVIEVQGDKKERSRQLATQERMSALGSGYLFQGLDVPQVVRVLRIVREVHLEDNEVVVREGEPGEEFFIVGDGQVVLSQGGTYVTTLGQGHHFGDLAVLGRGRHTATAVTRGPVRLLSITQRDLYELLRTDTQLGFQLLWRIVFYLGEQLQARTQELTAYRQQHRG